MREPDDLSVLGAGEKSMRRHSLRIAPAGLTSVDGIMAKKVGVFCIATGGAPCLP